LKVCDPACGSGHFLIAAAHRIAKRLAAVRTGDEEPAPEALRQALRDVIGRCIFGVDINLMAVELCKINLWLESLEPGKPLSFLDHHIQCGNSLLGATPALLNAGIPDEAFTPIEGDDKKLCTEYKKQNRDERRGQKTFFTGGGKPWERMGDFAVSLANLETMDDDSLETVRTKEDRYAELVGSADYLSGRFWADTWCAAFVWKKTKEFNYAITEDVFRRIERNPHDCTPWMRAEVQRLAQQYKFLHWHLAFPQVFRVPSDDSEPDNEQTGWSRGFDLVLGNPPWETAEMKEKEWFAECRPDITNAQNASARRKMIAALQTEDPQLYEAFADDNRRAEGERSLLRLTGRYPLCARGKLNTYSMFAELNRSLINTRGHLGCIVPSGIATDETTKFFFQDVLKQQSIVALFGFINEEMLFPAVLHNFKFALLILSGPHRRTETPDFVFNCYNMEHVADRSRHFSLTEEDVKLLNPNTMTCPVFFWKRSAEITKRVYRRVPILQHEHAVNTWDVQFYVIFNMSTDSHIFRTAPFQDCLPLYEAKMVHQYNHRFASYDDLEEGERSHMLPEVEGLLLGDPSYVPKTCYFVPRKDVEQRVRDRYPNEWLVAFREITSVGLQRTTIYSVIPLVGTGHKQPLVSFGTNCKGQVLDYLSCMNSFVLDFVARQKLGGATFSFFVKKQLAVIPATAFKEECHWARNLPISRWLGPRVLELIYSAWDLNGFAREFGYDGPPFRWDDARRFLLRSEIDAAYFHLYGIERDDVDYIMETFPIVKRRDQERHGEYRTKRVILEIYDAMAEASQTGHPYQSLLDPPPGPPATSLPDWQPGQPRPANWPSHIHPPRHASGNAAAGPQPPPPSERAAPAVWRMTRGQYQDHCTAQGRTDLTENNRTYWREVESAIQSGKPVPPAVLAEYMQLKGKK